MDLLEFDQKKLLALKTENCAQGARKDAS